MTTRSSAAPKVTAASLTLAPGDLVELFVIDLSPLRVNQQFAFTTRAFRDKGPIIFQGVTYTPLDCEAMGFELTARGAFPQPVLRVSNAARTLAGAALLYDDLVGAKLTRIRTYAQFLDNGTTPDPAEMFAPDIYTFEQKTGHNKKQFQWKLAAAMDQEGRKLPSRVILRDLCMFRYPRYDEVSKTWDFAHVVCPYAHQRGFFDEKGNATADPAQDRPSRKLSTCCKPRFGAGPYPFGGFPGVQRVRV